MTDLMSTPVTAAGRARVVGVGASIGASLVEWLVEQALPRWATTGVDEAGGGFFEKIDLHARPVEEPRRARVVARQIYVFATAARRGWLAQGDALVDHGLDFLLGRMRLPDGTFAASVRPDGTVVDATFDLYEHAFILFALASACRDRPERVSLLRREAEALLRCMRQRWAHPYAGFEEALPPTLPLKSNPHMHLLEASMAWAEISEGDAGNRWNALTDELVGLCLNRLIDTDTGALHEYFDHDWYPMPDRQGRIIEPGHQFEWGWLLMRWARQGIRPLARAAADRLLEIGETYGVDPSRGVAVDMLEDGFGVTSSSAKLWPQTERIKAWHAVYASSQGSAMTSHAERKMSDAVNGLSRYLLASPAGLWQEQMSADGGFVLQDCRASSLYHIVCAIDTLTDHYQEAAGPRT